MENELNLNELMNNLDENNLVNTTEEPKQEELKMEDIMNISYDLSSVVKEPEKMSVLNSLGMFEGTDGDYQEEVLEEIPVENDVKIDLDVTEPNIILPRAEIVRALKYAGVMIKKVTNDIESSSLHITYKDDGKVEYRLKDNMTWVTLEGTCKVSNNNPLLKTLSFNTTYLTKLLSASASDILIYEGKAIDSKNEEIDVLYARLINGDFILDYFEGDESKLIPSGNKTKLLCSMPASVVLTLCDVMLPLVSETQEIQNKRAVVYEERAFFTSSTYLLEYNNEFSRMCLGKKELDLLKLVSAGAGKEEIEVYSTDSNGENRVVFVGPNVEVSTSVSIPNRNEVTIARLTEIENAKYMKINKDDLKRVLFLSGLGRGNVARVSINYSKDGTGIDARTIGKDGNSSFTIAGDNYNGLEPRNEDVILYAPHVSLLLKSFEGGKSLEVALLDNGVAFYDSTLGIRAIVNYSRK